MGGSGGSRGGWVVEDRGVDFVVSWWRFSFIVGGGLLVGLG